MFSLHIDTSRTWRGGQWYVMQTVLGLRSRGHRAVLVAHPEGELFRRMQEGHDLLPLAPRGDIDLTAAWRLSRVLKQLLPDVIHAHDPHAVAMTSTALSIASPKPRPFFVSTRRVVFRLADNSFSRWKYSEVDCFIASCAAVRDRLVTDGIPRARITIVHEGVDVERIARLPSVNVHAEFFMPHGAPVVANVAALTPHKGQHHLIDAAALVVRDVPDARFVIVGEGELRQALEKQIKEKHLERHVFLAGFRVDAIELTKACDLFAISSIHDGLSMALIDAMAMSKPVVATAVGGIPEAMLDGETGYLVPPRDHRAMADRLVFLLKHPAARQAMGEAAYAQVRDHFSEDRMIDETLGVYEQRAGRRRAADTANPSARA
jgi:glycosyltransferase involved in cell wall biosynthesis